MNTKNVSVCYNERAAIVEAANHIYDELEEMEDNYGKVKARSNPDYRRLANIAYWLRNLSKKLAQ